MDRVERQIRRRKAREQAIALLAIGLFALLPPLAGLFELDRRIFGLPFTLVYLFTVWAALIVGAAVVARRLQDDDET